MANNNVDNFWAQPGSGSDNELVLNGTFSSNKVVQTIVNTVTLAEVNAGKTLFTGIAGKTITVVGFDATVDGLFITTTSVDLEDTNGTPVAIATTAVAALTDGAVLDSTLSGVTMGAGFLGALTTGAGIAVTNTGSTAAGGTSITYKVDFIIS